MPYREAADRDIFPVGHHPYRESTTGSPPNRWEKIMAWKKPVLTEVCVAMEINGYMPIEF